MNKLTISHLALILTLFSYHSESSKVLIGPNSTQVITAINKSNQPEKKTKKSLKNLLFQHKSEPKISVYFSPPIPEQKITCTDKIIKKIDSAKKEILIQAYSFTSQPIIDALVRAHKRDVKIKVILDKTYAEKPSSKQLRNHGIPVYTDILRGRNQLPQKHHNGIAHNKIMLIDSKSVITGSFNFTNAAEHNNTENIVILNSKSLVQNYVKNYKTREKNSVLIDSIEYQKMKSLNKKRKNKKRKKHIRKN